jgi:endonuclease/exonuclease/phosphatase family metal-dependent hydrolase
MRKLFTVYTLFFLFLFLQSNSVAQKIALNISAPRKSLIAIDDQPSPYDTLRLNASDVKAPLKLKFSKNDFEFVVSAKTFADSLILNLRSTSIDTLIFFRVKAKKRDFSKMFIGLLNLSEQVQVFTVDRYLSVDYVSGYNISKPIPIIESQKIFTGNYSDETKKGYSVLGEVTAVWENDNFGYMQDASGGMASILIGLVKYQVGDSLIIGSFNFKYDNEHNGEIFSGDGVIYKLGKPKRIIPRLLKYADIKPEYTGTLVTVQNLKFDKTGNFKKDTLYSVTDGTNKYAVRIYQSNLVGSVIPNLFVNITGILTKRLDKWFLLPRNKTDIAIAISIKQARQTPLNQTATVYGRVTANNQFGATVFLQDATAGIAVFSDTLSKSVQVGDSVSVTGTTALFNGLFQLSGRVSFQKFAGVTKAVTPLPIRLSEMRLYESQLVTINDLEVVDKKFVFVPNTNYAVSQFVKGNPITVKDTTFTGEMRIVNTTNLIGRTKPQTAVNVTGIVSQFNGLYQLQPRSQADVPNTQAATRTTQGVTYDKTFDLVTWNTNWLGNRSSGPTNEPLQQANFKRVLDSLQADIFVFQEVSNQTFYRDFVAKYPNYKGFCSSTYSLGGVADDAQRVCFLYRRDVVDSVSARPLLRNATPLPNYPSDPARFWASGRLPFMFTADVNIDGVKKRVNIVGLHARANTSATTIPLADRELQYRQRRYDVEVLKDSLDKFYANDNLFIVGDYNDDVDETVSVITSTKESSYKKYVDDTKNYQVITKALSDNGFRSFVSQNNVIDHIMISNELTNTYLQNSVNVELPFVYIPNYTTTTSDHLPVLARFQFVINAPSEMTANTVDYQGINLTWKDNTSDEKGFELERSADNKTFTKISDVAVNTTTFSDKNLEANKKYYYRVRAITGEGASKYATAEATTAVILGEESETKTFFKISPNPSNGNVNITLNDPTLNNTILNVSLMTIDGKNILQTEGKLAEINSEINTIFPKRATGTYLLRLEVKDRVGVLKVVKE